jgi:CRP-like cAMP-binding protein
VPRHKNPSSLGGIEPPDDYLADVPAFSMVSARQRRRLTTIATRLEVPAGETTVTDGDQGAECIVVLYGAVDISHDDYHLVYLERGDCYGVLDLLARRPGKRLDITASTPAVVDVIAARDFFRLLLEAPVLAEGLVIGLARRLIEVTAPPAR